LFEAPNVSKSSEFRATPGSKRVRSNTAGMISGIDIVEETLTEVAPPKKSSTRGPTRQSSRNKVFSFSSKLEIESKEARKSLFKINT
jgi:hypothetical protein